MQRASELPEHSAALRRRAADAAQREADADTPQPHPLVALGAQVGNAQVERMLAQREGAPEEEEEVQAQHDLQREGEEEEEVQAKHDLQREGEEDEEEVQAQHDIRREGEAAPEVGLEGGPISAELSGRIDSRRGGGAPLDAGSRTTMEGAFGTSFDDVRLHTDAESDALNRSISARAFTTGSDIFFRQDASPSDQGLLAHELTHVVQQRGTSGGGTMRVGPAGDSSEQHADSVSSAVTSGAAAQAQREADEEAAATVARQDGELEEEEQAGG